MSEATSSRQAATRVLQGVIVLVGIAVLAFMLWEPHLEGRNAHATVFEIYFNDPFLAYVYLASIAFFVALVQAFKLLGYVGRDEGFSPQSVRAVRTIKYCAMVLIAMIAAAVVWMFIAVRGKDDIAGGVAMGTFLILTAALVATAAAMIERRLRGTISATNP